MIGTQYSSVAPGKTVDSTTTTPPRAIVLPTVSLARFNGLRSGWRAASTGVGTVMMKKLQPPRSPRSLE